MSKKTGLLLGILLTIIVGTLLYVKFCSNCDSYDKNSATTTSSVVNSKANGLDFKGTTLDYKTQDNFNFKEGDFIYLTPISDSVQIGIDKLKADWAKNPNQKMVITGYCTSAEKNTSAFPNLGFARANQVKNYLVTQGIASNQLEINGELKDISAKEGIYYGPISYSISENSAENATEDWAKMKADINANPLTVYFNTNQNDITLSDEERTKIANISKYLDHVEGSTINIVGHTDNVGNRDANIKLSKERADYVAEYFGKNGVSKEKMQTSSKGPDEPIADNATTEGKAKNRRTVVNLQ